MIFNVWRNKAVQTERASRKSQLRARSRFCRLYLERLESRRMLSAASAASAQLPDRRAWRAECWAVLLPSESGSPI